MSTTGTVLLVGGVGAAVFLYMRSQQKQQAAVTAAALTASPSPGGGSGGGIGGLASRAFAQFRQDPLGIANTKAALGAGVGVVKAGISEVAHLPTDIIGGLRSIF